MAAPWGEYMDVAVGHVRAAAAELPAAATVRPLEQLRVLVERIGSYPAVLSRPDARGVPSARGTEFGRAVEGALEGVREAAARATRPGASADGTVGPLRTAGEQVAASRDLLGSHRLPNGRPATPYLRLFAQAAVQRHVTARLAGLMWETSRVLAGLADRHDEPAVRAALLMAREEAVRASVLGRVAAAEGTAAEIEALPVAPVFLPDRLEAPDLRGTVRRVEDACDGIGRAVHEASLGGGERPLSGSDLRQMARSLALGHLLAGRVLLHLADEQHSELAGGLRQTAGQLRGAAMAWQETAAAWEHIVDLRDPREHPRLPRFSYDIVRNGGAVPLPRTTPHPATLDAHALAVRWGQLLYGPGWSPTAGARAEPRPAKQVLRDAGGLGPLLAGVYRLPATGEQLAQAGPHILHAARPALVTVRIEGRPLGLPRQLRWYPVPARHLDALANAYPPAADAEHQAVAATLATAEIAGTTLPRARLDAALHRISIPPGSPPLDAPYASAAQERKAAREVARAYTAWTRTDMGARTRESPTTATRALREAWRALMPDEPSAERQTAAIYHEVARTAGDAAGAAAGAGRFPAQNISALRTVAEHAQRHSIRLAATLRSTLPASTTPPAPQPQTDTVPPTGLRRIDRGPACPPDTTRRQHR
ncbi:hypothetical protein [Streptomyces sp. B6B3]|uniref:hypothetical protein n=1 Tax=Streptomyces sp. B6B3 TaxID=3153570 RepID=UPI00325E1AF9